MAPSTTTGPIPLGPPSAPDQTATASPLVSWDQNITLTLERLEQRRADFPTLQSFSAGLTKQGEWVLIGGRTNGLHGFSGDGIANFPPSQQNTTIWLYDPISDRSWSRSLAESGLSPELQLSLSTTNAQAFQQGDVLFRAGGYVYDAGTRTFKTDNRLAAIDLGDIRSWVKGRSAALNQRAVLAVSGDPISVNGTASQFFAVTGGEMLQGANKNQAQLIFGQDFAGGYSPGSNGTYTEQVRNFTLHYKPKKGTLSYSVNSVSEPDPTAFHRRDLNILTQLTQTSKGKLKREGLALGGVFYNGTGVWTVPVEVDLLTGQPSMADPSAATTFRQAINQYTAASMGLFSRQDAAQTNLIFGGISAITLDPAGNPYYVNASNSPDQAFPYPFTSQVAAIRRDAQGQWQQSIAGSFPSITNPAGQPLNYGASAAFLPVTNRKSSGVRYLADGVLDLDWLRKTSPAGQPVHVGYVLGGIESQVFDNFSDLSTYGGTNYTKASGEIFKVLISHT